MGSHQVARSTATRSALALAVVGLALLTPALAGRSTAGATGAISIDQKNEQYDGQCVASFIGRAQWSYDVESTADHFRLTVHNPVTLCDGVEATAAIYTMPSTGSWPQQLAATERFSIREASTTVVTFTKDCQPAQFDVLTGDTPTVIDITGPYHGPLLFPAALDTTQQHRGPGCVTTTTVTPTTLPPSSTSTSTTSTSTTSTSTTSTSVASVAGAATSSTTPEVGSATAERIGTPNGSQPQVLGATATRSNPKALALTGGDTTALAGAALLLLAVGAAAVAIARRRGVNLTHSERL